MPEITPPNWNYKARYSYIATQFGLPVIKENLKKGLTLSLVFTLQSYSAQEWLYVVSGTQDFYQTLFKHLLPD